MRYRPWVRVRYMVGEKDVLDREGSYRMQRSKVLLASVFLVAVAIIAVGCGGPGVGELTGIVTDGSGKAIGQAVVKVDEASVNTSADGAFHFKEIKRGTHNLTVEVGGEVVSTSTVEISEQPTVVTVVAAKGKVSGVVKDHEGNATAAMVSINDNSTQTTTGNFTLDGVYYGTQTLSVTIDGAVVHTQQVVVDRPEVSVTVDLPDFCRPGPNAPVNMELVLCENFQDGRSLAAYGWESADGWKLVEADGKRWIESPAAGVMSAFLRVPQLANANKVVVEYTTLHALEDSKIWGVNILADEFPGGNARRGGTNFWAVSWGTGLRMRRITNNNYPGVGDPAFHESQFPVARAVPSTLRVTYDHAAKTLDLTVDGERAPGYPWTLADSLLVRGSNHNMLILYSNGTTARWTDFKVWVAK